MKLKVIAGAKVGAEIPLKRSKFLIGRSSECTLCASSEAISRRHCVILTHKDQRVSVRDLGSRNGTLVNGEKIEKETLIRDGDRLQVGPLSFEFVSTRTDQKHEKKPKVRSVAEAVERTASQSSGQLEEDDISKWLLGDDSGIHTGLTETLSFKTDETRASNLGALKPAPKQEDDDATLTADSLAAEVAEAGEEPAAEAEADDGKKKKKKFGKLPSIPKKQTKDSREAAADILREMARRR